MADKETGLNITVGAVADENSAEKAAKDLTKGVLSSLKDGYIEVPAEIKVPIKGASKELEQAQKKVLTQWKKTFKKGFSSSEEDLTQLVKDYTSFKKLAKGKTGTEQSKWITNTIGKQISAYKRQLSKQTEKIDVSKTKIKTKTPRDFGKHSKAEINANIKSEQKRRYKGTKSVGPAGYGSGWVDPSRTNEREAKLSEVSSYPSNMARQLRQSEKEAKKWEKASLTVSKPGGKAIEQAVENARKSGKNKNQFSAEEKAAYLGDDIRKNIVPELIGKIKASEDEKEINSLVQKFSDTLDALSTLNLETTKTIMTDFKKTLNILMGSLGFTTKGNIGGTDGDKRDWSKEEKTQTVIQNLLDKVKEKEEAILQQTIKLEELEKKSSAKTKTEKVSDSFASRVIAENKASQLKNSKDITQAVKQDKKATERQTQLDVIEHSAERVADSAAGKKTESLIKDTEADLSSGFNTDSNAMDVLSTLQSILSEVQSITKNGLNVVGLQRGQTSTRENSSLLPVPAQPEMQQALKMFDYVKKYGKSQAVSGDLPSSTISTTVKDPHSWVTKLKDTFAELTNTTANYKVIMAKTSEEQDKMMSERIKKYGISRGNGPTDTGDKTMIARRLSLFRNKDYFKTLFKDINLTEGVKIDTTDVTDKLAKALSGREMFKAQTGGWLKNILGAATGGAAFAFQPSLEKSRARAEGVNQIMANIRKVLNDTVQDIQDKESKLRGMKASGDLKLDAKGNVLESSSTEAKALVLQLQESKDVLNSVLADTKYVDEVVSKTHGRIGGIIKQLGFTSPVLRKNNTILANLNAGLDKSGKALKYQTRLAEILGYSFRLISRHVGQMFKNLLLTLSPINLIKKAFQGIKGLFQDFAGYNTKWQRTMNVIKYNLHAILEPFMDKIAQFLVNCIGFIDIISMKVQEAFGYIPISLFDQAAAQSQKIHEELEAAANVTAGFDELHDIGSDNTGANDLMGDIYKPELPQDWIDLANEIGDLFAGLIKGDIGFGEVMNRILEILGAGLAAIGEAIWNWFKETPVGKWITENWQHLLWTLLNIFIAWKLLKIIGPLLLNAFTGWATKGVFSGLLGKILGWIGTGIKSIGTLFLDALTSTQFGSDMVRGFKGMFTSGGMIGAFKSGAASLGTIFAQGLVAAAGIGIGVYGYTKGFDMAADDYSYNAGLMAAGGKEKDKKDSTGAYATSMGLGAAGGAITGFAIGGPIGALIGGFIGAVGGAITTSLAPAFEEAEIAARNMNNEMQKIEYYEGAVQGASSEVNAFTEQMDLLTGALSTQTSEVYKQGEQLGISKTRMDQLIIATQNGTFTTDMLSGSEQQLADKLVKLNTLQGKVQDSSEKLTEAKRKLAKAEVDLAIAQDLEAGNFEMAEARIEVAWASDVYTTEDANKKISQILKRANKEQRELILDDMSDEIDSNWRQYVRETEEGASDLSEILAKMDADELATFSKDYADEASKAMQKTVDAMQNIIDNAGFFDGMKSKVAEAIKAMTVKSAQNNGIELAYMDVGTNYVPNDGLAYIHKGEAIIPADQNVFADQGKAFSAQSVTNEQLVNAISRLEEQMKQGINVTGQFVQKGTDLVASVEKTTGKLSNSILNNKVYAR